MNHQVGRERKPHLYQLVRQIGQDLVHEFLYAPHALTVAAAERVDNAHPRIAVNLRQQADVVTRLARIAQLLGKRQHHCFDDGVQVPEASRRVELVQHLQATRVDACHTPLDDGFDETLFRTKVIVHGRHVALSSGEIDFTQGDRVDAAFCEQPLRRREQTFPCINSSHEQNDALARGLNQSNYLF